MGKYWVRLEFCGVVSLNLVEEDYKDKTICNALRNAKTDNVFLKPL
jgi:hypothetical protein